MKSIRIIYIMPIALLLFSSCKGDDDISMPSERQERKLILKGNSEFADGNYQEAADFYRSALKENPSSPEALYNNAVATMAVAEQRMAKQGAQPDSSALKIEDEAIQLYMKASMLRDRATGIAALACYNLGNHYFRTEKLDEAEIYYRQSLRLNPDFDEARRNLRITQLRKEQNEDKNQDKNQQNQNQDQDKDNKQDQQQNDRQQEQQNQNQQQQPQQQQSNMTPQAARQILNANENKEQNTRARIERQQQQQRRQGGSRGKKW